MLRRQTHRSSAGRASASKGRAIGLAIGSGLILLVAVVVVFTTDPVFSDGNVSANTERDAVARAGLPACPEEGTTDFTSYYAGEELDDFKLTGVTRTWSRLTGCRSAP